MQALNEMKNVVKARLSLALPANVDSIKAIKDQEEVIDIGKAIKWNLM